MTTLTPRGAERGRPVEIVVTGTNLTPKTQLLLPFKAVQTVLPDAKPNPAQVRIQLTVEPSVPLGVYPLHVWTEDGVSGLQFFSVDVFPGVNEVEDNSTFDKTQKITPPVIVTGQCAGGDVDFYRFAARKGQRLVLEAESARLGSGILPQLRLTDGERRFLAADDSQSLQGDARIVFEAPAEGDYVLEISDSRYRGANPPHYRLKVAEYDVVEEVFPLGGRRGETVEFTLRGGTLGNPLRVQQLLADTPAMRGTMPLAVDRVIRPGMLVPLVAVGELPERLWLKTNGKDPKALDVLPPLTINGRLERKGDVDRFQFSAAPGQRYHIGVQAETFGSQLDGVLRVLDQGARPLALVDDVDLLPIAPGQQASKAADPVVDLTVPANVNLIVVELRDQRGRGGINYVYRLTIEPAGLDFAVQQPVSEINVPRGGSAALSVPVVRRGYLGPVQLTLPELSAGLSVQGGLVPANGTQGVLTLSAASDAPSGPFFLQIEGRASSEGRELIRTAVQKVFLSREASLAASVRTLPQFTAALTAAEPFTVQAPGAIEAVQGYPATVPVTVTRAMPQPALAVEVTGATGAAVPLRNQPPPGSLVFKPGTVAAGAPGGAFTLTAPVNSPEGLSNILIQGKARVNNADRVVIGQAVTLTVRRPFFVELATPSLELVPGQTITLKGKLVRQPVFQEVVQLKLDGLPAGVTLAAPPTPLSATASDFQIDLKVAPKVAAAKGNLSLTCSTTIAGMAYSHPPVQVPVQVPAKK